MNKTIQVINQSVLEFKPDQTIIELTITNLHETYEKALFMSQEESKRVKGMLVKFGFSKDEMKTSKFHINTEYEYKKTNSGLERKVIAGYKYSHTITVKFGIDNELLSKVLYSLTERKASIHVNLSYSIKDKDELEKQVLDKCIKEAKEKAKLIAKSSDVELGMITKIQYSKDERELSGYIYSGRMLQDCYELRGPIDIDPESIKVSQGIVIDWEIK